MNWRGRPLTSHEVVVNSIAATRTRTGLTVHAALDPGSYPTGIAVSRQQLSLLPITPHQQHGPWNYTIAPAAAPGSGPAPGNAERDQARATALAILADSRLTGMDAGTLDALVRRLAPLQAAQAEARKYQQRGGPRRQAKGDHGKALLSDTDRVLITVLYQRQVCSQTVLMDMLGLSNIGQAVAETSALLRRRKIDVGQTTLCFSRAEDLRDFLKHGPKPDLREPATALLTHPALTGMNRADYHALQARIATPYAAIVEQRRHQRRGGDKQPGTRGGIFRQKITDADRILATILSQRKLCSLETLAELFDVSRATIRNAMYDVMPLLDEDGFTTTTSQQRFSTAADIRAFATTTPEPPH
jgi:Rhodopirellula transposase DDE domain/DeoR-like helix-turn-helix domain